MDRESICESLDNRWELFSTELHPASFMLDPRFNSIDMSDDDKAIAEGTMITLILFFIVIIFIIFINYLIINY